MTKEDILKVKEAERSKCDTYSRSMGYVRPTKNFNVGKLQEHKERLTFDEAVSASSAQ